MINVLIACEESQVECSAFLGAGCNAYSCDLQECSGCFPSRHIIGDVRNLFVPGSFAITQDGFPFCVPEWDLIIAHPPCTYLSKAAGINLKIDRDRYRLGLDAARFFMEMYNAPAKFVAVENPIPYKIFNLPHPDCAINPSDFGAPWLKKTLYWLRNLPPLMSEKLHPTPRSFVFSTRGGKRRSKSFPEVAAAMVHQWLPVILNTK